MPFSDFIIIFWEFENIQFYFNLHYCSDFFFPQKQIDERASRLHKTKDKILKNNNYNACFCFGSSIHPLFLRSLRFHLFYPYSFFFEELLLSLKFKANAKTFNLQEQVDPCIYYVNRNALVCTCQQPQSSPQ